MYCFEQGQSDAVTNVTLIDIVADLMKALVAKRIDKQTRSMVGVPQQEYDFIPSILLKQLTSAFLPDKICSEMGGITDRKLQLLVSKACEKAFYSGKSGSFKTAKGKNAYHRLRSGGSVVYRVGQMHAW